jgi:DNA-binding NarL/FixJ family response regulator
MSTTVMIVDDHEVAREGLRALLAKVAVEIVGEASSGLEAVKKVKECRPDVVLLDFNLPDMDGADACSRILEQSPGTAVVILSAFGDDGLVRAAVDAGARGYLLKDAGGLDLSDLIARAIAGERVIDPRAAAALMRTMGPEAAGRRVNLTPQEMRILELVGEGLSNPDIGAHMHLSKHTVKEYLGNAMQKLGVTSRVEAVLKADRLGLVKLRRD